MWVPPVTIQIYNNVRNRSCKNNGRCKQKIYVNKLLGTLFQTEIQRRFWQKHEKSR